MEQEKHSTTTAKNNPQHTWKQTADNICYISDFLHGILGQNGGVDLVLWLVQTSR